jgi:hypothetical protein
VDPSQDDLERLLRTARPTPRPGFVRELERTLRPQRPERRRLRLVLAATGVATALASLVLVLSIAGLLPGSSNGSKPVQAAPKCRTVIVERRERRPYFVRLDNGELRVRYHMELVRRPVRRCR